GIRVHVDDDPEHTPGWKYYYWEMKGVPTRLEIGRREVNNKTATIARRDGAAKKTVPITDLIGSLKTAWNEINEYLRKRALEHLERMTIITHDPSKAAGKKALIITPWDGTEQCAEKLEAETGKPVLGGIRESPLRLPGIKKQELCSGEPVGYALLGVTY
ncbi:TPA: proline--tRNA ligase, partial [Candidatus Micrarchaeota archaeon]|nr:proline--tRNA ligase [Candidatus Micrarchaeota archaeon]